LYLANFLAAAISEPALYRLLTFHVPNKMSLFLLRDTTSRNTPPAGDPSWGVVYLRIVLSPEEAYVYNYKKRKLFHFILIFRQ